jgi:hypothetical protein
MKQFISEVKTIKHHLNWRIENTLLNLIPFLRCIIQRKISNIYFIIGSGRSGTTWLAEILSEITSSIYLDEPLKNSSSKRINSIGFTGWGQYIPADYNWPEAEKLFTELFTLKFNNPNINYSNYNDLINSETIIVKSIRSQFLLKWLFKSFPEIVIIHLIRNPFHVIESQLNHPGWGLNRERSIRKNISIPNDPLSEMFYKNYVDLISQFKYLEEFLAFRWSLENYSCIQAVRSIPSAKTVSYEQLQKKPESTISLMIKDFETSFPNRDITHLVNKPSRSRNKSQVDRKVLTEDEKCRIKETLIEMSTYDLYDYKQNTFNSPSTD